MTAPLPRCGDLIPDMEHLRETAALFHAAFQSPLWRGLRYPTVESVVAQILDMWRRLTPKHGGEVATAGIALFYIDHGHGEPCVFVTLSPSFLCDCKRFDEPEDGEPTLRIVRGTKKGDPRS